MTTTWKQKNIDRSIGGQPTKWDTYQRNASGQYVFLASGNGTSRQYLTDKLYRGWWNQSGWRQFRKVNGYLPTMAMEETHDYVRQELQVPTYLAFSGQYRVEMKTPDPVYVPAYSGVLGTGTYCTSTTSELENLRNDAKMKCLASARDMKVNVAVMFAEGRDTIRMLADTLRTLGTAYRDFRRGRFRQAAKKLGITPLPKQQASHWLGYQLGWMPMLSDAVGLAELARNGLIDRFEDGVKLGPRFSVRGKSSRLEKSSTNVITTVGASNLSGGQTTIKLRSVTVGKAGMLLEVTPTYNGLASIGLGGADLLNTAWEKIPFSFVFDYFIGVGNYLESFSSLEGLSILAGFESHEETIFGTSTMDKPEANGKQVGRIPSADITWRSYKRYNWTNGAVKLQTPIFDALNAKRVTNMAALWLQRTRGDRNGSYRP